ncbi:very short patch repair endonuclease [Nocardia pseudovaccinii]|uniref:very short patch repair endonuclease n=1 Tax=Nocardia pseudovaccinii TaxID=189540 RepID=UPI0009FFAFF4|nr:very short patch repair endonuclease [Nocardia pseudovaccinii]
MADGNSGNWKEWLPPDRAWKCPSGLSRAERTGEQDRAAGGRHNRLVDLGGNRVSLASIELKVYAKTRRIRAYIRWSDRGKYPTKYVGEVDRRTRKQNLVQAWNLVRDKGLLPASIATEGSWASTPAVRSVMRANRGRDTKPEIALRSALRAQGLRYRVGMRPVPDVRRTADVVFLGPKVAVFCDGCYWHGCPDHYRPARINSDFWQTKISGNILRDRETDRILTNAGWHVVRIWEHEDPEAAARVVADIVAARRNSQSCSS